FARLGGAVTPPIVLAIVARSGWRTSFIALGAASLAWTVAWLAFFTDTPEDQGWFTDSELADIRAGGESTRPPRGPT
ncbi:MFS transporter, partial [Escherichia coli]|uniref:MFS transporter n=1 Tax=Escherichia coli TaxID=562 RepID=UPI0028EA1A1E